MSKKLKVIIGIILAFVVLIALFVKPMTRWTGRDYYSYHDGDFGYELTCKGFFVKSSRSVLEGDLAKEYGFCIGFIDKESTFYGPL